MGAWSLFFLAKLALYVTGRMALDGPLNIAFAVWLVWPLLGWHDDARRTDPMGGGGRSPWRTAGRALSRRLADPRLRRWAAPPLGLALLYHDSFLPAPSRLITQWHELSSFSAGYWFELAGRLVSWPLLVALVSGVVAYFVLARRLRMTSFVFAGLLAAVLLPGPGSGDAQALAASRRGIEIDTQPLALGQLDAALGEHYDSERAKRVHMPQAAQTPPKFDLVFLSICSLSWDDLDQVGLRSSAVLQRLDVMFRRFNTAASYSGPAVLRLLHGSCGNNQQRTLYQPAPETCYLFRGLEQAGYEPALLLNHDGHFGHFSEQLKGEGGMGRTPEPLTGGRVAMHSFDGTPIYDDYERLADWWKTRVRSIGDAHFAVLYNTITLHDGNRVPGLEGRSSLETYKPRAERLFADVQRFFNLIEASQRPTVVVLVPEHGAAVRGDPWQIAGMREFPVPRITHVPAGVAFFGFGDPAMRQARREPVIVEQVSSYASLVALVASLMHGGPDAARRDRLQAVAHALPPIEWVAENEDAIVLRRGGKTFLRSADSGWRELPAVQ